MADLVQETENVYALRDLPATVVNTMCYLQRTNGPHGHIHYTSGCTDMQVCTQHNQTNGRTSNDMCLQCCDGSFCNSHGCGDNGFPMKELRGPICLDCSFASDHKACDKVTICGLDELCHIEELPWGANSIFHLGCKSKRECALWTGSPADYIDASFEGQGAEMQRSVPLCKTCCQNDYCNRNCTSHNNNNQGIIVG
ncbi:uncharacterized protein LOC123542677 [Mercenaria mercenaria]|uniref:uncharacterized protein LOC123542677 n=1 Tax=Mercenaria mercenaria TaxID=6596 RepID=UPI00234F40DD|nr:uncharacterized protein LOC123542677 [Mercenaria mercenaria]